MFDSNIFLSIRFLSIKDNFLCETFLIGSDIINVSSKIHVPTILTELFR